MQYFHWIFFPSKVEILFQVFKTIMLFSKTCKIRILTLLIFLLKSPVEREKKKQFLLEWVFPFFSILCLNPFVVVRIFLKGKHKVYLHCLFNNARRIFFTSLLNTITWHVQSAAKITLCDLYTLHIKALIVSKEEGDECCVFRDNYVNLYKWCH